MEYFLIGRRVSAEGVPEDFIGPQGIVPTSVENGLTVIGPDCIAGSIENFVRLHLSGFQIFKPDGVDPPAEGIFAEGQYLIVPADRQTSYLIVIIAFCQLIDI